MTRLFVFVLLLWAVSIAHALNEGEKEALEDFQTNWPDLQLSTPPWNRSVATACDPPVFYGLTCSTGPDPHITELYVEHFFFFANQQSVFPGLRERVAFILEAISETNRVRTGNLSREDCMETSQSR